MFFFSPDHVTWCARSNRLGGLLENLSPRYFEICDHDTTRRRRLREAEKLIDRHSVNLCRISRSLERMHIQIIIDDKLINLPTPTFLWPLGWNCRDRLNIHEAVRIIRKKKKRADLEETEKARGTCKILLWVVCFCLHCGTSWFQFPFQLRQTRTFRSISILW